MKPFFISLFFSLFLSGFLVKIAPRLGFVDCPDKRRFHPKPTPLLGGVAIFLSFCAAVLLCAEAAGNRILFNILTAGFLVALLGLADDKLDLGPGLKLSIQCIAAVFIAGSGIRISLFLQSEILSFMLTVFWIVFVTNGFNLLDNMDGISAGVAFISSLILWIISAMMNEYFISVLLSAFMGSLLGFLFFNFPPAKIFMGDCGSQFIGFMIAVVTILGTYYKEGTSPTLFPVVIPLVVLAVPIFDTLSVVCIRLSRGEYIFKADKNHFSHRLVSRGMNVRTAVWFVYLVTFCTALPAILLPILPMAGVLVVFLSAAGIISIIAILEYYSRR